MYKLMKIGVGIFTLFLLVACSKPAKTEAYFEKHPEEIGPTLEKCKEMETISSNEKETCRSAGRAQMFRPHPKKTDYSNETF